MGRKLEIQQGAMGHHGPQMTQGQKRGHAPLDQERERERGQANPVHHLEPEDHLFLLLPMFLLTAEARLWMDKLRWLRTWPTGHSSGSSMLVSRVAGCFFFSFLKILTGCCCYSEVELTFQRPRRLLSHLFRRVRASGMIRILVDSTPLDTCSDSLESVFFLFSLPLTKSVGAGEVEALNNTKDGKRGHVFSFFAGTSKGLCRQDLASPRQAPCRSHRHKR